VELSARVQKMNQLEIQSAEQARRLKSAEQARRLKNDEQARRLRRESTGEMLVSGRKTGLPGRVLNF
jgi:hypothetical protein